MNWLAISPNYAADGTLLAATTRGLYKTSDRGERWEPADNGLQWPAGTAQQVRWAVFSPAYAHDRTAFVLTDSGFLKSTDGASSWEAATTFPTLMALPEGYGQARLLFSPNYAVDRTVFLSGFQQRSRPFEWVFYRSTDDGATWQLTGSGLPEAGIDEIVISPAFAEDRTLFATTNAAGFYKSANSGESWERLELTPEPLGFLAFSPDFATDRTMIAKWTEYEGSWKSGLLKSVDAGATWTRLPPDCCIPKYIIIPSGFGAHHQTLYGFETGYGVGISTDGGATWRQLIRGLPDVGVTNLAVSPEFSRDETFFVGIGGHYPSPAFGVFRSLNGGQSWSRTSEGLNSLRVSALATSPAYDSDGVIFGATNGELFRSLDRGRNWHLMEGQRFYGNLSDLAVSPAFASDGVVFASQNGGGVLKSTDRGVNWEATGLNWQNIGKGLPDQADDVTQLVLSPGYPADPTIFARTGAGILRSANGGAQWNELAQLEVRPTTQAQQAMMDGCRNWLGVAE